MARVYHVPPDKQSKLTAGQFRVLRADYERLMAEEQDGY